MTFDFDRKIKIIIDYELGVVFPEMWRNICQ